MCNPGNYNTSQQHLKATSVFCSSDSWYCGDQCVKK